MDAALNYIEDEHFFLPKKFNDNNVSTTNLPSLTQFIENEAHQTATVIIVVILAVLIIILIFMMAIFIDCRQQKIQDAKNSSLRKRTRRRIQKTVQKLSTIGESSLKRDDHHTIVDNMEVGTSTSQINYV